MIIRLLNVIKTSRNTISRSYPIARRTKSCLVNNKMFRSSVFNLQDASQDQVQEFLNSFDTVLTDCDGMVTYYYIKTVTQLH